MSARYRVAGPSVDSGAWVLVPVILEAATDPAPQLGDVLGVTFQFTSGVASVSAGFGLTGGGDSGQVTISADTQILATKSDLAGMVLTTDPRLSDDRTPTDGSVTSPKLAAGAVTYAKIQNVSTGDRLLGRSSAVAGQIQEIACSAFGRSLIDDPDQQAARQTLGAAPLDSPTFTGTTTVRQSAAGLTFPLTLENGASWSWGVGLKFAQPAESGGSSVDTARIVSELDTAGTFSIRFHTMDEGTVAERLRITGDGRLAVNAPSDVIEHGIVVRGYTAEDGALLLKSPSTSQAAEAGFVLQCFGSLSEARVWNYENSALVFATNDAEKMRLTSAGRLGVGRADPATALDVNGIITVGASQLIDGSYRPSISIAGPIGTGVGQVDGASGTVSLFTQGVERLRVESDGCLSVGGTGYPNVGFAVQNTLNSASERYGAFVDPVFSSASPSGASAIVARGALASSANVPFLNSLWVLPPTVPSGAAVEGLTGLLIDEAFTSGGTTYGVRSRIPGAANRWNIFADGTAPNYFAGDVHVGSAADPNATLDVRGSIRAASLTDGTTSKPVSEVLSPTLAGLADVNLYPTVPGSYPTLLMYTESVGWTNADTIGKFAVGTVPLGGWLSGTVGDALSLTAPKLSPAFSGNAEFTASSGVPVTILNTGTGNSLVVNDQSADATPFVIDAAGRVGVGVAAPASELHVAGTIRATSLTDGTTTKSVADIVSGAAVGRATHVDQKRTPTASEPGSDGALFWDDNYLYLKTTAGWKKVPLYGLAESPNLAGNQVQLTQAQYNALSPKDPNTLYIIVD